jgi:hypothetical protein
VPEPAVIRVTTRGRRVRAALTVVGLVALAYGSVLGDNKMFPIGPMTQYAFYVAPDGVVKSTSVWADTTDGTRVHVPLDPQGVGVKRADVEAQLPAIIAHPELLRTIATAQRRLHPHQPQYVRLFVMQTVFQLRDRVPVGHTTLTLAEWTVTP